MDRSFSQLKKEKETLGPGRRQKENPGNGVGGKRKGTRPGVIYVRCKTYRETTKIRSRFGGDPPYSKNLSLRVKKYPIGLWVSDDEERNALRTATKCEGKRSEANNYKRETSKENEEMAESYENV